MTTEAQQLLDAAFAGKLDLDADASQATAAAAAPSDAGTTEKPVETPAADKPADTPAAQDDEPAGTPIASKSGAYQIPFERLSQARQERDTFKGERDAARAENDQLKAQLQQLTSAQAQNLANAQQDAQARADAGKAPTQADQNLAVAQAAAAQGVDISVFGDFSEEGIARGVAAMVEQRAAALVDAKLEKALEPYQKREAQLVQRDASHAIDAHSQAIYAAHKDADEIFESSEFQKWMGEQPGFARAAIEQALTKGSSAEVIEVFSTFKAAAGKTTPADVAAKALENVKAKPPVSLSEMPGASDSSASEAERVSALAGDPAALLDYMAGLSPEKQNRLMNSVV